MIGNARARGGFQRMVSVITKSNSPRTRVSPFAVPQTRLGVALGGGITITVGVGEGVGVGDSDGVGVGLGVTVGDGVRAG